MVANDPAGSRRSAWAAVVSIALAATLAASGCDACASSHVDPADLEGVFDPRPTASASSSLAKAAASGSSGAAISQVVRDAPAGTETCVEERGTRDDASQRTVGRPACRAAEVLEWRDASGAPRYGCVYGMPGGAAPRPRPLVVYFHGTGATVDDPSSLAKLTGLRQKQAQTDLTGGATLGFTILSVQGRAIAGGRWGTTFDTEHRSASNLDVTATDHFIDELRERGLVDDKRIYSLGTGRGGTMAITYAMLRADRVAAFGAFAPPVPSARWSCDGPPPPGMVVYRACDAVAKCDDLEGWLLDRDNARAETRRLRLGESDREEPSCAVSGKCSAKRGEAHHQRWPKGREKDLLAFFGAHSLR